MQTTQRTLTSAGTARVLGKAGIPATGANKLKVLSTTGSKFIRDNGTAIRIFNVQAFRSKEDADYASTEWKEGTKLEKAGDIEGAQEHFRNALNSLMSFSVLEDNATAFEGIFEVACMVEVVPASAALKAQGIEHVLGINSPRPVTVTANVTAVGADLFTYEEKPATTPARTRSRVAAKS